MPHYGIFSRARTFQQSRAAPGVTACATGGPLRSSVADRLQLALDWLHNKELQVFDEQSIYKKDGGLSRTQLAAAPIVCGNNGRIPAGDFQNPAAVDGRPEAFEGSARGFKFRRFPEGSLVSMRRFGGSGAGGEATEELPAAPVPGSLTSRD